ncbi:helix-turn-helix domain-containing protein [Roseateles sp.]|uniref:helix-turn-helix domain-containing protein n=1 Tax=Roseateles sp. TaxID=1971397 RepID=UPI00391D255A
MSTIVSEAPSQVAPDAMQPSQTAGGRLRAARQAQGLSIATLAARLKVPQAKLEAMEADRHQDLPDATFTRALAKAMCRALQLDAAPVLDLLPRGSEPGLDRVSKGLNTPFRERMAGDGSPSLEWLKRPMIWGPALLLAGALAVYLLPNEWLQPPAASEVESPKSMLEPQALPTSSPAPAASADAALQSQAPVPAVNVPPAPATAASAVPVPGAVPTPTASAPLPGQVPMQIKAREDSWVEVSDAQGQVLFSRLLRGGEQASLNVQPPLRLRVGNVAGTDILLRGSPVDLAAQARDNVLRMELK